MKPLITNFNYNCNSEININFQLLYYAKTYTVLYFLNDNQLFFIQIVNRMAFLKKFMY